MAQCKWIMTENDEAVKKGKVKVGDRCRSMNATDRTGGYCFGHAMKLGIIKEAPHGKLRPRVKKATRHLQVIENDEISQLMGEDIIFDLEREYEIYKELNKNVAISRYSEMVAYARWLDRTAAKRIPNTIAEVSKILGVDERTLTVWDRSPVIARIIKSDTNSKINKCHKLFGKGLLKSMREGEKWALELYAKYYMDNPVDSDEGGGFDEKEYQEACKALEDVNSHEPNNFKSDVKDAILIAGALETIGGNDGGDS